ncbi:hypothetical protein HK098_003403 [Nowakowskiella sp. JEL0407]|nr:hypothetical protein HK098_003403 [Nowakowskiella sp. JEL0407]
MNKKTNVKDHYKSLSKSLLETDLLISSVLSKDKLLSLSIEFDQIEEQSKTIIKSLLETSTTIFDHSFDFISAIPLAIHADMKKTKNEMNAKKSEFSLDSLNCGKVVHQERLMDIE